ncbi:unnamed protein product [Prunus armeniaca]|uniref:Uncharacterized protein n=1 Tax=Prunus armeniaca TaxID=36596 RepID=A0A6J5VT50_PRUAR|nr:unnamed protein product [Prunus armeniaca]CAB4292469.1 unnamed protein product [Prunus armeniaca]
MEGQQSWRPRLSFRSATIMMCLLNVITALLLLQGFLSSASSRSKLSTSHLNSATLRYVRESEEIRLAMRPLELIKRVKEIQQEANAKPETVQEKDTKQTVAGDLSKRLKDLRSVNDATSFKAVFPVWDHIMTLPAGSCILEIYEMELSGYGIPHNNHLSMVPWKSGVKGRWRERDYVN